MKKAFGLVCALLLVSLFLPGPGARPTYAGTNYVVSSVADDTNSDGQCTLREAILAAEGRPLHIPPKAPRAAAHSR